MKKLLQRLALVLIVLIAGVVMVMKKDNASKAPEPGSIPAPQA